MVATSSWEDEKRGRLLLQVAGEEQTEGQGIATSSWERFTKRGARRLLPVGIVGQPPTNLVPRLVPKTLVSTFNNCHLFGVKCRFLALFSAPNLSSKSLRKTALD